MRKIRELNKKLKERRNSIDENISGATFIERRKGLGDRRKLPTFIANDRRSGIVDRRKKG